MPRVFISYSRRDKDQVARLAQDLELRQAEVWTDRRLASGERYIDRILRQIAEADHRVTVLSRSSKASSWVAFETGAALAHEVAEPGTFHLLRLDNADVPGYLSARQATRIDGGTYNDGLRRLCHSLDIPTRVDRKKPSGRSERHLKVFQAGEQWMELLVGRHGLECVLVDGAEQRARVQWTMTKQQVRHALEQEEGVKVRTSRVRKRPWGTFDIGGQTSWRWSPFLFGDRTRPAEARKTFEKKLRSFLERG